MGHCDGGLRQLRRGVQQLRAGAGRGQAHSRGRLCCRVPTPTGGLALWLPEVAGTPRAARPEAATTRPEDVLDQRLGEAAVAEIRSRDAVTLGGARVRIPHALDASVDRRQL